MNASRGGESARQSALEAVITSTPFESTNRRGALRLAAAPTPLQRVQDRFAGAFQAAREELDEREYHVLLDVVVRKVSRLCAEGIVRETGRRAA